MSGVLANISLKFLRDFFFTLNVSVFLQLAAIYLKIAGVIADHISFSQMVFFIFMLLLQNVLINEGLIAGAILKGLLCHFLKSTFFIKLPRCKSVRKKPHTICSISFCPIQKLCDQCGSQPLSVIPSGRKGNEFQIAFPNGFLIPFL